MATHTSLAALFSDIADKIRQVGGGTADIVADEFPAAIEGMTGGSWLPSASTILATFARRQSGGRGPATLERIYGKTGIFRQLRRAGSGSLSIGGVTTSYDAGTGKVCIHNDSRTELYNTGSTQLYLTDAAFPALAGHKIAILFSVQDSSIGVVLGDSSGPGNTFLGSTIVTLTNVRLRLRIGNTYDFVTAHPIGSDYYFYVNFIDLTDFFGAGNEPTDIADVREYFPQPFYAYDAGSLLSVKAERILTQGRNLWDEQWESGYYNTNTGAPTADPSKFRSANLITAFGGVTYFVQCPSGKTMQVLCFDANKALILGWNSGYNFKGFAAPGSFTAPAGTAYLAFHITLTTYGNDICISESNAATNGQYFPHHFSDCGLPILKYFPDGLKSAGSVYDELTPKQAVQRVGTRAYQAGDEDDATLTTDGTNTNYPLAAPVTTDIDEDLTYLPELGGTEEIAPVTAPFSADIRYAKEV